MPIPLNCRENSRKYSCIGSSLNNSGYIHGIEDSRNPICRLISGAFGAGMISRIVRGYTYISRKYEEGDSIVIVGFSRGAYTARALAGLIISQGLLAKENAEDREKAYCSGAKAWYGYRAAGDKEGFLQKFVQVISCLPAFLSTGSLEDSDLRPVDSIARSAYGIPLAHLTPFAPLYLLIFLL